MLGRVPVRRHGVSSTGREALTGYGRSNKQFGARLLRARLSRLLEPCLCAGDASMRTAISRRRLLKSAGALASGGILLYPRDESSGIRTDDNRPRVLALIGDRYHNADYIRVALDRLFRELNLPIDFTINYDQISARLLASYRLFVVLRDGMIWPKGYLEPNDYE